MLVSGAGFALRCDIAFDGVAAHCFSGGAWFCHFTHAADSPGPVRAPDDPSLRNDTLSAGDEQAFTRSRQHSVTRETALISCRTFALTRWQCERRHLLCCRSINIWRTAVLQHSPPCTPTANIATIQSAQNAGLSSYRSLTTHAQGELAAAVAQHHGARRTGSVLRMTICTGLRSPEIILNKNREPRLAGSRTETYQRHRLTAGFRIDGQPVVFTQC